MRTLIILLFFSLIGCLSVFPNNFSEKQRLIVATDLGGADPDDVQSLIHLLVCSDVVDIEGIISSPSWIDCPDWTANINKVIADYAVVLPRLRKHSEGFPDADFLKSVVKRGQAVSNMAGVGEGKDSSSDNKGKCKVIIPNDARDRDFHVILVLTDSGEPSLTAYRRFVIDVK